MGRGKVHAVVRCSEERRSVPLLGHSTDRRSIEHTREVFREDNVQVLMRFVCARKEVAHAGFDKFGEQREKGDICYRIHNMAAALRIIAGDKDSSADEAWQFNMSAKRFKDTFGQAVSMDTDMQDGSSE